MWHSENAASGSFCSSGSVLYCTCKLLRAGARRGAPGSRASATSLSPKGRAAAAAARHTKKRAWPFLFNFRIFPRRCLAVAIPFFGRLPVRQQRQSEYQRRPFLTAPGKLQGGLCGEASGWARGPTPHSQNSTVQTSHRITPERKASLLHVTNQADPRSDPASLEQGPRPRLASNRSWATKLTAAAETAHERFLTLLPGPHDLLDLHRGLPCHLPHPAGLTPYYPQWITTRFRKLRPSPRADLRSLRPAHTAPPPPRPPERIRRQVTGSPMAGPLHLSELPPPLPPRAKSTPPTDVSTLPFVAWLLIGGGFDAGLLVG